MWTTCFLAYSADHAMWASEVLSEYFCNLSSHRFTQTWTTHDGSEIRLSMLMKRRFRTSLSFVRTFTTILRVTKGMDNPADMLRLIF